MSAFNMEGLYTQPNFIKRLAVQTVRAFTLSRKICQQPCRVACRSAELIQFLIADHSESDQRGQLVNRGRATRVIECSGEAPVSLLQQAVQTKVSIVRGHFFAAN